MNPLTVFEKTLYYCLFVSNSVITYCNLVDFREHQHPDWFPFDLWFPLRSCLTLSSYTSLETEGNLASFLPVLKPVQSKWMKKLCVVVAQRKMQSCRGVAKMQCEKTVVSISSCVASVLTGCHSELCGESLLGDTPAGYFNSCLSEKCWHVDRSFGRRQEEMFFVFQAVKLSWTKTWARSPYEYRHV